MHTFYPTCSIIQDPITGICRARVRIKLRRGKMVPVRAKGFALHYRSGHFKTRDGQRYSVTNGAIRRID